MARPWFAKVSEFESFLCGLFAPVFGVNLEYVGLEKTYGTEVVEMGAWSDGPVRRKSQCARSDRDHEPGKKRRDKFKTCRS